MRLWSIALPLPERPLLGEEYPVGLPLLRCWLDRVMILEDYIMLWLALLTARLLALITHAERIPGRRSS